MGGGLHVGEVELGDDADGVEDRTQLARGPLDFVVGQRQPRARQATWSTSSRDIAIFETILPEQWLLDTSRAMRAPAVAFDSLAEAR